MRTLSLLRDIWRHRQGTATPPRFLTYIVTFRCNARLAKGYYLAGLRGRLLAGQASPQPSCVALNAHLRLLPNGDVPVCQFNTRTVGNLRQQTK